MLDSFKGLKIFQLSEYLLLALFAFVVPFSWRMATFITIAIFAATLLKGIFEEGFKPNPLQYQNKFTYIVFIAFWFLYAISFFYSENTAEARIQIGRKLPFFLFPIFFLCSNLSYLNKDRVRTIMYCFVFGILTLFIVNLLWAGYDVIFEEAEIKRLTSPHHFFKTNDYEIFFSIVHRAYFSAFTCLALVFCCIELFYVKNNILKLFNILASVLLIFIPFFLTSRSGMLCTALTLSIIWIWITFVIKRKYIGILSGIIMGILLIIGYLAFPKSIERYTNALNNIKEGKGEIRLTIRHATRNALYNNIVYGAGVGDRNKETMKSFQKYKDKMISKIIPSNESYFNTDNNKNIFSDSVCEYEHIYNKHVYKYADSIINKNKYDNSPTKVYLSEYRIIKHCMKHEMNAHNQFSDTIIAVGIIGLLLFLMMLIIPIYLGIKNKKSDIVLISLVFTIAFNSLFESVLERQMGIMFFVFFYFILFHGTFCQQRIENRS